MQERIHYSCRDGIEISARWDHFFHHSSTLVKPNGHNVFFFHSHTNKDYLLSYDVASVSEITPCNKIDKLLVVYRFLGNVMTSIKNLRT